MSGMTYFQAQLEFISRVTQMLNNLKGCDGFYIHVELRDAGSHRVVGEWSDEIAPTDWYYAEKADGAA